MVTYLDHSDVPRCGHSETLINVWRQMEAVRRGSRARRGNTITSSSSSSRPILESKCLPELARESGKNPIFQLDTETKGRYQLCR